MNRNKKSKMKKALQEAFAAPAPKHKQEFFKKLPRQRISICSFLLSQAGYIHKLVWGLSLFVFVFAVLSARQMERNFLWQVSSLMPFVAMTVIAESIRSRAWQMEELELACRFSLKSVILARLGLIGSFHMLLLLFFIPFASSRSVFSLWETGIFLLVPYLATTFLGLCIIQRLRGKEGVFACFGLAFMVSAFYLVLRDFIMSYRNSFAWWVVACLLLIAGTGREYKKVIEQAEEM